MVAAGTLSETVVGAFRAEAGAIVPNPHSLTRFANILYVDPRQAGFSYDVVDSVPGALDAAGAPTFEECSRRVFNEYVDAADVLFATMRFLRDRPALRGPVVWFGESYAGARIQWMLAYLRGRSDVEGSKIGAMGFCIGGHMTYLVGWEDYGRVFIGNTSYGLSYGDNGFYRIFDEKLMHPSTTDLYNRTDKEVSRNIVERISL